MKEWWLEIVSFALPAIEEKAFQRQLKNIFWFKLSRVKEIMLKDWWVVAVIVVFWRGHDKNMRARGGCKNTING